MYFLWTPEEDDGSDDCEEYTPQFECKFWLEFTFWFAILINPTIFNISSFGEKVKIEIVASAHFPFEAGTNLHLAKTFWLNIINNCWLTIFKTFWFDNVQKVREVSKKKKALLVGPG